MQSAEEHPDTIIDRNLKNTALDRRPIEPDLANPAPEWTASYLQKIFLNVFLTGDAAYDQQRSVPLSNANVQDDSRCKEEYIKTLSQQKDAQQLPEFLFTLVNLLKKLDAQKAAKTMLREVDVTTIPANLPTDEDLSIEVKYCYSSILGHKEGSYATCK